MSKSGPVQERPKPPSFVQMKTDVENVAENDVVFVVGNNSLSQSNIAMIESFMELSPLEQKPAQETPSGGSDVSEEVEKAYQDTLHLLKLNEILENASELLEKKCTNMELLGSDINLSISKLQDSTESVGK